MPGHIFKYKFGVTANEFFSHLKPFLHVKLPFPANEAWLEDLRLRIAAHLKLSPVETEPLNSARTQREKLLVLFSIIESRGALMRNSVWEDTLNCIINNPHSPDDSYTAYLRSKISEEFSQYVEIKPVKPEARIVTPSPPVILNPENVSTSDVTAAFLPNGPHHRKAYKCSIFKSSRSKGKNQVCDVIKIIAGVGLIIFAYFLLQPKQDPLPITTTPGSPTTTENVSNLSNNKTLVNNITPSNSRDPSPLGYAESQNSSAEEFSKPKNNETSSTIASESIQKRTNVTNPNNINLKMVRYHVTSCEDYKNCMSNPPQNKRISIHIHLSSPYDWENCDMVNAEKISKLSISGPITLADTFLKILNCTKNLEELVLNNTNGAFCKRNKGQLATLTHLKVMGRQKVELPKLNTLYMQDFTSCNEVFEALANHISYGHLARLALRQCVYDNENQVQIEHLLETNGDSLKSVNLSATQWATTLVSKNLDALRKVEIFQMDFKPYANFQGSYLGKEFGRVFPNIQHFLSSAGYLPLNQLPDIFQLKHLKILLIRINLPEGNDQFDVSFLRNFPDMVKAEIVLEFQNCRTGSRKNLVALNTLSDKLSSLIVRSNCRLFTPGEKLDKRVEKTREKGCLYESAIENITE